MVNALWAESLSFFPLGSQHLTLCLAHSQCSLNMVESNTPSYSLVNTVFYDPEQVIHLFTLLLISDTLSVEVAREPKEL